MSPAPSRADRAKPREIHRPGYGIRAPLHRKCIFSAGLERCAGCLSPTDGRRDGRFLTPRVRYAKSPQLRETRRCTVTSRIARQSTATIPIFGRRSANIAASHSWDVGVPGAAPTIARDPVSRPPAISGGVLPDPRNLSPVAFASVAARRSPIGSGRRGTTARTVGGSARIGRERGRDHRLTGTGAATMTAAARPKIPSPRSAAPRMDFAR